MTKREMATRITVLEKTLQETRQYLIETREVLLEHMRMDNATRGANAEPGNWTGE